MQEKFEKYPEAQRPGHAVHPFQQIDISAYDAEILFDLCAHDTKIAVDLSAHGAKIIVDLSEAMMAIDLSAHDTNCFRVR
jgi:hypothetical protein